MSATQSELLETLDGSPAPDIPEDPPEAAPEDDESAPSPEPEEAGEAEADDRPERRVSIHALHEERERRKEAELSANELRERTARMEQRFEQLQRQWEVAQQPKEPQEPAVSYDENPAEFLRQRTDRLARETETLRAQRQQQHATEEQRARYDAFRAQVTRAEESFATAEKPDYWNAVAHLRDSYTKEMVACGVDPEIAQQETVKKAHELAAYFLQKGANPAQAFYQLARERGYSGAPPSAAPAAGTVTVSDDVGKLATVRRGVEQTQGLGSGGETNGRMTLSQLSELDDDEFAQATAGRNWEKLWR